MDKEESDRIMFGPLAKINYETYKKGIGIPQGGVAWDQLPELSRNAWIAATASVIDKYCAEND